MPLLCLFSITDGLNKTESKGKDYTSINVRKVLRNEKKKHNQVISHVMKCLSPRHVRLLFILLGSLTSGIKL